MRHLLALLLVVACKEKPPDAAKFAAMTADAQCEATAPRAIDCIDEIMVRQLQSLRNDGLDQEAIDALSEDLRKGKSSDDEAREIHRTSCRASEAYAGAVFACWDKRDCKTFADCVAEKDGPKKTQLHGL